MHAGGGTRKTCDDPANPSPSSSSPRPWPSSASRRATAPPRATAAPPPPNPAAAADGSGAGAAPPIRARHTTVTDIPAPLPSGAVPRAAHQAVAPAEARPPQPPEAGSAHLVIPHTHDALALPFTRTRWNELRRKEATTDNSMRIARSPILRFFSGAHRFSGRLRRCSIFQCALGPTSRPL